MTSTNESRSQQTNHLSRRRFISKTGAASLAFSIVPSYVLGQNNHVPPSEKLNVAVIGTGGQGIVNIKHLFTEKNVQIIAIADVMEEADYSPFYYSKSQEIPKAGRGPAKQHIDQYYAQQADKVTSTGCRAYVDFRKMLDKEKDIDAVLVATPDHVHAIACLEAIARGKHVYCEKPLTRTVYEAHQVTLAARRAGVATQMGNQGHSGDGIRMTVEWIQDGAIGPVHEVHVWTNVLFHAASYEGRPPGTPAVPQALNWDLWLGPVAHRPYHPAYAPYMWRGWWAFAGGALGDMGCHNMDPAIWALDLGHPTTVEARSVGNNDEATPYAAMVYYQFPARGSHPPVKLTWYSGMMPPRVEELDPGTDFIGEGNGIMFVGEKGKLMCEGWAGSPRFIPMGKTRYYKKPTPTIPRSQGHHRDWINACKGGKLSSANFDYGGHLTELVQLGNVAIRAGKKLSWDGVHMKATNCPEADAYIRPVYENSWKI